MLKYICSIIYTLSATKYNNMKKVLFIFLLLFLALPIFACLPVSKVSAEQININTATLSQLDELTGIGPTYAQRIVDDRPYSSIDDLDRVKGIGPATIQKIKDQGFACVNCQTTQPVIQPVAPSNDVATPALTPAPTPETTYPSGIFINEVLPNPVGPDETDEWIELYNSNNFDVDLSGWQLQDRAGTITTYTIPSVTKIMANGFLVFKRPDTQIMLNNDQDGLNLLTPDGKIVESMGFMTAPLGQSYNKTNDDWSWSTTLTPGTTNIITAVLKPASAPKTTDTKTVLPKTSNSVKNNSVNPLAADLSQSINTNQASPWFLFFAVLAITIVLAILVILIKLKIQNHVRT